MECTNAINIHEILAMKIMEKCDFSNARNILELASNIGLCAKKIYEGIYGKSTLYSIDVHKEPSEYYRDLLFKSNYVYIQSNLEQIPDIVNSIKELDYVICNASISMFKDIWLTDIIKAVCQNLNVGGRFVFNVPSWDKYNDEGSSYFREILIQTVIKHGYKELALHFDGAIKPSLPVPFWVSSCIKFGLKLIDMDTFEIEVPVNSLKEFYKKSFYNKFIPASMKDNWENIVIDALEQWESEGCPGGGKWKFMPGTFQTWTNLTFAKE